MKKTIYSLFFLTTVLNAIFSQSSDSISFTVQFNSGYLLNKIVRDKKIFQGCAQWRSRKIILMDSANNVLAKDDFWSRGIEYSHKTEVKFKDIIRQDWYFLKYDTNEKADTIEIGKLKNGKLYLEFDKEETARVQKENAFIDRLQNGDTLNIYFSEYGCDFAKGNIQIIKNKNQYLIKLIEKISSIEKTFIKNKVTENDLSHIRAFEYDSFRSFYTTRCHDMGYSYFITMNNETREVQDECGNWGGYYLLKKAIFRN